MKKLALLLIIFCFSLHSYGQVTGVAYVIEKDNVSGDFDCKLIITEGTATTAQDLEQLISTFTIVVPTGTNISYIESYNPLTDNQTFMGTIPMEWQLSNSAIAPNEQPESDYYSYSPQISPNVNYNALNDGDVVSLFRFSAEATCNLDIRPIDNDIDATILSGTDYSNGFTIGNTNQIYSGNQLPSSFDADFAIAESEVTVCLGECVTITPEVVCAPLGLTYSWSTGETTESITVCPAQYEIYDVTVIGPAGLSESTTVSVLIDQDVIYFDEVDFFCVGQSYFANSEFGNNNWASSDESIASFDNNELLIYAEGTVTISSTSPGGCVTELEITTSPLPNVGISEPIELCVGDFLILTDIGYTWTIENTNVATIDDNGNVTAVGSGTTLVIATDILTGCSSTSDNPIVVLPAPFIQNTGSFDLCIGETTLLASANDGTWESNDPEIASINNSGLVTALTSGFASFTFTETESGCTSTIYETEVNPQPQIISGAADICIGETTILTSSEQGTWVSDKPDVATISEDGVVVGVSSGIVRFYFTSNILGCTSQPSNPTTVNLCMITPALACDQVEDVICDIDLFIDFVGVMLPDDSGGNQPNPLCQNSDSNGGGAHNISWLAFVAPEGNYTIEITPNNCTGSTTGQEGVQIGIYLDCTFSESVYCNPTCSTDPVYINSEELVSGETYFFFIDGCSSSVCEYEIDFIGNYISQCESPCDDESTNTDWVRLPAGEFNADYNIIAHATASNLLDSGNRDHLVFYDYNTGNVYLKENNGNGFLDNEILLFNNIDHYANGEYKLYLEDIDNDGLTDIVLAESNIVTITGEVGDQISVYQNLGNALFERQINEQVCGMAGPNNLKIVDYDNDGIKDIFFVCLDFLYDILWINSWSVTEKTDFNDQTFCHVYTGDFNQDGFQDIGISDEFALINNGDRTFNTQELIAYESGCSGLRYFIEETNNILDPNFSSVIVDPSSLETEFCSDHSYGDNENEIFRAYIISPDIESIIIPQVEGFHFSDPNQVCNFNAVQIPNAIARQNTKIDITLNGCTDFLVIEGDQIYAWINPKQSTKILGTAFIDDNANGIYDSNELPLRNVLVSISPGDFSILTDDDGHYSFSVPPGVYTIIANVNEGEWIQNELTINNIQITEPCNEGYNFPFVSNSGPAEMATISMVNTIARCDFETRFTITVENTGAETLDAVLSFTFDDQTTFFSSEISGYQVNGNTVTANIGSLAPFSPQTYKITLKMPSGSSNLPMLAFEANLFSQSNDLIAEYGYSDQLRCSYDPNDKREYPDREGEDNLTLMDEDIEYTIRFQNNGNDTAFLVKIVDPLDPSIDPSTIRVMNASHPVETCIEGTDLIFLFEDILLVDSTTNYPASQGFVTFRCNAKDGRAEMTPVHNQADIIFDTNEPIITNQTINTLVSVLCTDKETFLSAAICDGESYEGFTESGIYTNIIELPFGCDSIVIIELDVQGITIAQNTVNVCEGESIFFNGINYTVTESIQLIDSVYSDIGCVTDILTLQVNVTPVNFFQGDFSLCEGEEVIINGNNYTFSESTELIDSSFSENGCVTDIYSYQIMVLPTIYEQLDTTICEGFDYAGLTVAGTYTIDSFDLATGCQLEYTINLEVLPSSDPFCTVSTSDFDKSLVKLYPNPATESIFIETDKTWESIKIVDIQGKIVKLFIEPKNEKLEINVSQYLSGVYMVLFQDEDRNLTKRFVVR